METVKAKKSATPTKPMQGAASTQPTKGTERSANVYKQGHRTGSNIRRFMVLGEDGTLKVYRDNTTFKMGGRGGA